MRELPMYEVWQVDTNPAQIVAKFDDLDEAMRFAQTRRGDGAYDIKMPSGRWYGRRSTVRADELERLRAKLEGNE